MTPPSYEQVTPYRNAIEPLVVEEIERQIQRLPSEVAESINQSDAIAYALNRLPPLYATTLEGWYWQQRQARESLADLIAQAASWGLKATQRKAKVFATPLLEASEAEAALERIRELLGDESLSWRKLVAIVEQALIQTESDPSDLPPSPSLSAEHQPTVPPWLTFPYL